jgi:hypothetical protein
MKLDGPHCDESGREYWIQTLEPREIDQLELWLRDREVHPSCPKHEVRFYVVELSGHFTWPEPLLAATNYAGVEVSGYYGWHKCCPRCGSDDIGRHLVGFLRGPDMNSAWCCVHGCGWAGTVHDLIPRAP